MFWKVLILAVIIIAIAFAGIGIKMFVKKDGRFERRCENEGSANCLCNGKGGASCLNCPNKEHEQKPEQPIL